MANLRLTQSILYFISSPVHNMMFLIHTPTYFEYSRVCLCVKVCISICMLYEDGIICRVWLVHTSCILIWNFHRVIFYLLDLERRLVLSVPTSMVIVRKINSHFEKYMIFFSFYLIRVPTYWSIYVYYYGDIYSPSVIHFIWYNSTLARYVFAAGANC